LRASREPRPGPLLPRDCESRRGGGGLLAERHSSPPPASTRVAKGG
jgi:hypothetical protein